MLRKVKARDANPTGGRYAIVASKYNREYVDSMVRAAQNTLRKASADAIQTVRVPGAYEIPVAAARLARCQAPPLSAIICLGVILRGATPHAQHIGDAVSHALMQIQILHEIPVIHEVLLLENHEQAIDRCLSQEHNRGTEAAHTAIEMAKLMRELPARQITGPLQSRRRKAR